MLEEFLGREVTAPIFAKGWVDVMIDVDRDRHGKEINERFKGKRSGGLPWTIILDANGNELVAANAETDDEHDGHNIGGPVAEWECAWFIEMLRRTAGDRVSADELARIAADLEIYARPRRR